MRSFEAKRWVDSTSDITIYKNIHTSFEIEHTHDFIEIAYMFSGEGYQIVNGVSRYVSKGDVIFLNFGDVHAFYPVGQMGVLNCLMNPEFLSSQLVNSKNALDVLTLTSFKDFTECKDCMVPVFTFTGKEFILLDMIFENMFNEYSQKETGYKTALRGYLDIVLIMLFRKIKAAADNINIHEEVFQITPQVLDYIEKNYNRKITLDELARQSFYNPSYFSTVFKSCFGVTITDYINTKRINMAIKYLAETNLSAEKISRLVGFRNKNQFYKYFQTVTGKTPNNYREKSSNARDEEDE